ncbi:hypothetical protein GL124_25140 [Escherichia coli]|nr:hypothetical protein [Escherichia coli]EFE7851983.1 hypothetical protein [Escherichia coli]EFH7249691.1 hypothetical protein [Escherichia coli]EFO4095197.1 hypothetical protein [Escherichia coli]RZW36552.1 hypothetical protein EXX76_23810 [Escherichia coli]
MKNDLFRKRIYKTYVLSRTDTFDYIEIFYHRYRCPIITVVSVRRTSNSYGRENSPRMRRQFNISILNWQFQT